MKFDLNGGDVYNFHRGQPVHFDMTADGRLVQVRRPSRIRRAWRRLMCWRVRPTFCVVTEVDVSRGTVVTESVPGRWSWRRWSWSARLP